MKIISSVILLLLLFPLISHGQIKPKATASTKTAPADGIYKVPNLMPRFKGCEEILGSKAERKNCAGKKMLTFIYDNLNYPPVAYENKVEGTVVIQIIVRKNGQLDEIKVVKEIGANCGKEAKRVIESMQGNWLPGEHDGKPVDTYFNIPVEFRLEKITIDEPIPQQKISDYAPILIGCDHLTDALEQTKCNNKKIQSFIKENLVYPEDFLAHLKEGAAMVSVTISPDYFLIRNLVIKNTGSASANKEAERLVRLMVERKLFALNQENGKPLETTFEVPIHFEINKELITKSDIYFHRVERNQRFVECEKEMNHVGCTRDRFIEYLTVAFKELNIIDPQSLSDMRIEYRVDKEGKLTVLKAFKSCPYMRIEDCKPLYDKINQVLLRFHNEDIRFVPARIYGVNVKAFSTFIYPFEQLK